MKKLRQYLNDYFLLIKFEQNGLFIALLSIIVILGARSCMQHADVDQEVDILSFKEKLAIGDESVIVEDDQIIEEGLKMYPFNPNTITQSELLNMGWPPSLSKSLINYRNSGFQYRRAEDLQKCYGMTAALFEEIAPFAVFTLEREESVEVNKPIKPLWNLHDFDPNTISRVELEAMNLPSRFVNGFLNYRNSGVRFYSHADMNKVYVLTDELKLALYPHLKYPDRPSSTYRSESVIPESKATIRFRFDPNSISRDSLILLGVKQSVAGAWVNYRNGGKIFYSIEDLQEIYGMDSSLLAELQSWIDFPEKPKFIAPPKRVWAKQSALNIDLNNAKQSDLEAIKGIGAYYASQILKYRDRLGGYIDVSQLLEIETLPDSTFQNIRYHFISPDIAKLELVNMQTVSRRTLADHPYMDYATADRIVTHREFVKRIPDLDYLLRVELLSKDQGAKMRPYLSFK